MNEEKYINQGASECIDVFISLCIPVFRPQTAKEIEDNLRFKSDKTFRMLKTLEHKGLVRKVNDRWEVTPDIVKISDGFRRYVAQKRTELETLNREYLS